MGFAVSRKRDIAEKGTGTGGNLSMRNQFKRKGRKGVKVLKSSRGR